MKTFPLVVLVLLLLSVPALCEDPVINPGSEYTLSQDPADGSAISNNGNITFISSSVADVNTRTLQATTVTTPTSIGTGSASAQLFYEFEVGSTPETAGNTVGAWINYVVNWSGLQAILAVGASNSTVDVDIVLRDVTGSRNLHFEPVHNFDLQTHRVKVVVAGINFNDSGQKPNTFPAVLKRGHTYRLTLRMTTSVFLVSIPSAGSFAQSTYIGEGVGLSLLNVKVGLDEKEALLRLEGLENHRHTYLTGRGEGHNNTQAQSSPPVFTKQRVSPKVLPEFLLEEDTPPAKAETGSKPVIDKR